MYAIIVLFLISLSTAKRMQATFKMIGNKTYEEIVQDHKNAQLQKLTKQQKKQDKKLQQFRLATLDYKKDVRKKPVTFDDRSYGILSRVDFDIPGPVMVHTPKSTKIEVTIPESRPKSEFEMIAQQEAYKPSPTQYSPQFNAFDNKIDVTIKSGKQHASKYKRDEDKFELSPCCYKPSYSMLEQNSKQYKINKSGRRTIFDIRYPAIAKYLGPGSYNPQKAVRSLSNSQIH